MDRINAEGIGEQMKSSINLLRLPGTKQLPPH